MSISAWTSVGQLAFSVATISIAFAVYRVQADKLFLDMRGNRIAAIDQYRDAINSRLVQASKISRANLEAELTSERIQAPMTAQWDAEREIKRWFGAEMIGLMRATDQAVCNAADEKIRWCSAEHGQAGDFQQVYDLHFVALRSLDTTLEAMNIYVQAGRRGLPTSASWSLWLSGRRLRRRGKSR